MEDIIKFLAEMRQLVLSELDLAHEEVTKLRRRGALDKEALDKYSRLRKAGEWMKGMSYRYFAMEGARLILAERLKIGAGMKVLDLGSGDGWFSTQAGLRYSDSEFHGVELSEEFAEAKEYAKIFGLGNTSFYYFDAYELPIPSESFHRSALFFSLGNIASDKEGLEKLFGECHRVLKKNGLIGIAEAFIEDFPGEMGLLLRKLYDPGEEEETLLSLNDVKEELGKGFEIRAIERIRLKESGISAKKAKEYLERYYERGIPDESVEGIRSVGERVWVRDDPPSYHILIAEKIL